MLITTTDTLHGVEIAEYIGMVTATTFSKAPGLVAKGFSFKDSAKNDFWRTADSLNDAVKSDLEKSGERVGADAVIGVRVNYSGKEDFIYSFGTAVKLKK